VRSTPWETLKDGARHDNTEGDRGGSTSQYSVFVGFWGVGGGGGGVLGGGFWGGFWGFFGVVFVFLMTTKRKYQTRLSPVQNK